MMFSGGMRHRAAFARAIISRPSVLLIVWFGIGELPKVVLILIGVLPIMIVSTVAALDGVPPELEQCARTLGASRIHTLFHVQLRASVPGIIAIGIVRLVFDAFLRGLLRLADPSRAVSE
jgi:ABC-type proline/glycine betaine transport system permease subunit